MFHAICNTGQSTLSNRSRDGVLRRGHDGSQTSSTIAESDVQLDSRTHAHVLLLTPILNDRLQLCQGHAIPAHTLSPTLDFVAIPNDEPGCLLCNQVV